MRCYIFCVVLLGLTCAALAEKRAACPEIYCFISCPNGYVTDKLGCSSCSCLPTQQAQSRNCEDWRCLVPCDNGYQLNSETGCLTCSCAPASVVDPNPSAGGDKPSSGFAPPMSGSASSGNSDCNRLRCLVPCDGGYEEDSQGCPTCVCRSSSSSDSSSSSIDGKPTGGAKTLVSETGSGENNNNNMSSGAARNVARFHSWILQILAAMGLRSG